MGGRRPLVARSRLSALWAPFSTFDGTSGRVEAGMAGVGRWRLWDEIGPGCGSGLDEAGRLWRQRYAR